MRNLRQRGMAVVMSMAIGAGMIAFGPTVHAASDRSVQARCANIARGIAAATALGAQGAELLAYLQGLYDANCSGL
jgi:hypothetical protein